MIRPRPWKRNEAGAGLYQRPGGAATGRDLDLPSSRPRSEATVERLSLEDSALHSSSTPQIVEGAALDSDRLNP